MAYLNLNGFFDELDKIADLMTPAVISDSATVDGPPATPFTKRKGYKKLEEVQTKEAALGKDFLAWFRKHKEKADNAYLKAGIKTYQAIPEKVRPLVTDPMLTDPSDMRGGLAAKTIGKVVLGSPQQDRFRYNRFR